MRKGICILAVLALTVTVLGGPRATGGRDKVSPTPQPVNDVAVLQAQGVRSLAQAEYEESGPSPVLYLNQGNTAARASEAFLYKNDTDSGYGVFLDYVSQTGAYYPGVMTADEAILGNGFVPGVTPITRFAIKIFRSTGDPTCVSQPGADFVVELWSGDPFDAVEADTAPHSILASCKFTGYPCGVFWLDSADPTATCVGLPVVPADPRTWLAVSGDTPTSCRMGWRLSKMTPEVGSIYTGTADVFEDQEDYIAVGTCCVDGTTACDTTLNPAPAVPCAGDATGSREYCTDNFAESAGLFYFGGPCAGLPDDSCASFVADIFTTTDTWMGMLPVGSDSAGAVIDYNTITLGDGDCNNKKVQFEFSIFGWDPNLDGTPKLKTWEIDIDDAGFGFDSAFKVGTLAYELQACTTSADCVAAWGGRCTVLGAACVDNAGCQIFESCGGSTCDYPTGVGGFCAPAYQLAGHPRQLLLRELPACDVSTPDFRCGSTLSPTGVAKADDGLVWYGGTLRMTTSDDVTGTATVITMPKSFMKDADNNSIPLVGVVNGYVVCNIGQCCNLSSQPFVCMADDVSKDQCEDMAGVWTFGKTCLDDCGCLTNDQCVDGDACTVDVCNTESQCVNTPITLAATECCDWVPANANADMMGLGTITDIEDGNPCTIDACAKATQDCGVAPQCGVAENTPVPDGTEIACDDENQCTYNDIFTCTGGVAGACAGLDVNVVPCTTSDDCLAETGVAFDCVGGFCLCVLQPPLTFEKVQPPPDNCYEAGDKVEVDIYVGAAASTIIAAQMGICWDPTCMTFESIVPGTVLPYEIMKIVGFNGAASVFYAVGVDPFLGGGANGNFVVAHMTFTKIGECNECVLSFCGDNPYDTFLSDNEGQWVGVMPENSKPIKDQDLLTMDIPDSSSVNVDCDHVTAIVEWGPPTADSDCDGAALVCTGTYPDGSAVPEYKVYHGGEFPIGISEFCCTATSNWCPSDLITECWTVEVMEKTTLDIVLQLSPIIAGADFTRCIDFELFANCIEEPVDFEAVMEFGGIWDYVGHFTDTVKVPDIGQWYCVTARDQLHTLRATAFLDCVDGVYEAVFKGDPFWGGNWLIGGNLDGYKKENPNASHNVIDILDFGQFVANYLSVVDPNTDCTTTGPHEDINGDGVVNSLDFAFIMMNFLAESKDACCPDGAAQVYTRYESVSVDDLRRMGMGELAVGDLNGDGMLDVADMNAFMAGQTKAPAHLGR